jgi:chitinase
LFNQVWAVKYYVINLVPKEKINIGVPTYGRSFTMGGFTDSTPGSLSSSAGDPGQYTNTSGFLAYYEVGTQMGHLLF